MRHAQADSDVPEGLDDGARPLTGKGRRAAEKHFRAITKRMDGVDLVLMSPLVRAVQTAQILALVQELDVPGAVRCGDVSELWWTAASVDPNPLVLPPPCVRHSSSVPAIGCRR